jgi:hypothetical protein
MRSAFPKFQWKLLRKGCYQNAVVSGFFVCNLGNRQGALADGLHGLNPRNTEPSTPLESRTALIKRLLIPLVLRWNPSQCGKRINPSRALGAFFVLYQLSLEREG